ncbi:type II toxin-antitoxin system PemK/MazF family toxin [Paracoccus pantotrophus]|nr:type II toxin-antitoxin system PemK/MazF family toxin [Paracoccus pantotrophus]
MLPYSIWMTGNDGLRPNARGDGLHVQLGSDGRCLSHGRKRAAPDAARSSMTRGDLVAVALQGDHGKPRPALIIQADQFPGTATVTVLLVTSTLVDAPLLRLTVEPSPENGLRKPSQIMIDKPMTVRIDKIGAAFGRLDDAALVSVNRSLALFLGLAG